MKKRRVALLGLISVPPLLLAALAGIPAGSDHRLEHVAFADDGNDNDEGDPHDRFGNFDAETRTNTLKLLAQGRDTFRHDTFGDEAFWGDKLRLHEAIATLSPREALDVGLKVDAERLPQDLISEIEHSQVDLDDPDVTLALLELDAVVGVKGFFDKNGGLRSVGIQCALCHSTVNDSVARGIGKRLDGWANRDLNIGAIIASAPNLQPIVERLQVVHPGIDADAVRRVLRTWGPGKFDAELLLDGKTQRPDGKPAATLIPNAYDLPGHNLHTWTGGWGTVTYWNALVAVNEMQGIGTFFDRRLDNADQFPIAARFGLGHKSVDPDHDRVTPKLASLHFYQLGLPSPKPRPGIDFNKEAAERGDELFSGKANCNSCHHEPLWTEPGWNDHFPEEMKIDSFQADRSPDHAYRTMNLAALFVREEGLFMRRENKGRYYHDGRFKTLLDVVKSYNIRFNLHLTEREMRDLVEYLKSL